MKSTLIKVSLFSVALASLLTACKKSGGFDTDKDTGVQYRFINHNESGQKPAMDDYAVVKMIAYGVSARSNADTEIFNSMKSRNPRDTAGTFTIGLHKSFAGCLEQGITLMSVGDSAEFKLSADSLYIKTFHNRELPKFLKPGSDLTFYIKLVSFQTKAQIEQMQKDEMAKRQAEMEKRKGEEPGMIADYLKANHYDNVKPSKDSLFVLQRKGGSGKLVQSGDSVYVEYTGTLLDGTQFDASTRHGGPLKLLYTPDMHLIKGWVEMLGTMHEGEKAMILVPSALAYGPQQAGPTIMPYSPLLFELDVTKVIHNKPMAAQKATPAKKK